MPLPRRFETPADLEKAVANYLKTYEENGRPLTVSGLAVFCGCNRDTIHAYASGTYDVDGVNYSDTIKKAMTVIEQDKSEKALTGVYSTAFSIFDLKNNHGWRDRHETDITTGGRPLAFTKDEENL